MRKSSSGISRHLPTASISTYLTVLAAVIALPLLAFAAFLLTQLESYDREGLRRQTQNDARGISRMIESHQRDLASMLRLLSVFPEIEEGDLAGFQARTGDILSRSATYLLVVDETGEQLLNSRVPFGAALGKTSNVQAVEEALQRDTIVVSEAFFGRTAQEWVFNVITPLAKPVGGRRATLILTRDIDRVQVSLSAETLPERWSAMVVDQNGRAIASAGAERVEPASLAPPALMAQVASASGVFDYVRDGEQMMGAHARVLGSSWSTVLWGPVASTQAPILSTWRWLAVGSLVFIVASLSFAYLVARQLSQPIRNLSSLAERLGRGEIVSPPTSKLLEANQIAIALSNASFERSEAEDRVHLMLRELVHRTKNVLTLVQAIFRQIARQSATKEEFQEAADRRLQGLARSVELLAQENWTGLPLRALLDQHLSAVGVNLDQCRVDGEDFELNVSAVQNLGLILHELATNAIKYGALSTPEGRVRIAWRQTGEVNGKPAIRLEWEESDGPPVAEPERKGFGTIIVKRHAAAAFSADITLDYRATGLYWALAAPLAALASNEAGAGPAGDRHITASAAE